MRIALTGNPNSGKTTMYNALAVRQQEHVLRNMQRPPDADAKLSKNHFLLDTNTKR